MLVMKPRKRVPMPAPTPFDVDPGASREVTIGRRVYTVTYHEQTWAGYYYGVHTRGRDEVRAKVHPTGRVACLSCQTADSCAHAWAAKRAHEQLWGKG